MAKKSKTAYFCQNCGYQSPKYMGKCPSCQEWNTLQEELIVPETNTGKWNPMKSGDTKMNKPKIISEIESVNEKRINTQDTELNRVLGGGIMPGAVVLIGGEPGIGKSTLMLELALRLKHFKILYVSGEESAEQIKSRADRLPFSSEKCFVLTETNTQSIFQQVSEVDPEIMVIDSIQTLASNRMESAAGSVSQVRECTAELIQFAKETSTPVFLIGHITKDGGLAGPKVLEHMVDTVLQFEGDRHMSYRVLRTIKNRFGSTSEIGIYEMRAQGLRQVTNPSEILISQRDSDLSGISIGATLEGNRPLLVEIQSLVSTAAYGTPQRSCTGFDARRLNMLLAVLEKRGGFRLSLSDVFLNVTGGLKIEDPAIDLAVCASVISSVNDVNIDNKIAFTAEVGLGGEIRSVNRIENRVAEAEKLGFNEIYISKFGVKSLPENKFKIKVTPIGKLDELIEKLFI
ncbi:DNA repair protein RadA [Chondrinema litorale]|uniref:DNA repair protein RadA n=1 Tax=Chondrinema litorale TaxID=2994555 RepID=UPI0025440F12|nr:DNA repair protein RadA [Chondrinema litorale]UZR93336.1 DNA repair protein RadA [Chondrinema litorale]